MARRVDGGLVTTVDIVTGASQGIGKAVADSIAHHRRRHYLHDDGDKGDGKGSHYKLVLVGRNVPRGRDAAASIAESSGFPSDRVVFEACDLGNFREVHALRERIVAGKGDCRIGILVNCAAECPKRQRLARIPRRWKGDDGSIGEERVDAQFATNVLGYHFTIRTFEDLFSDDGSTRVVNVASNWAGDLDLSDLSFLKRRRYDNDSAYRQSKQCDRMLSVLWANKLRDRNVSVNACHPGDPCTTLSKDLGYNLWAPPPDRAMIDGDPNCPIPFLCGFGGSGGGSSSNDAATKVPTGMWFEGSTTPRQDRFASRIQEAQELFEVCESYCV